MAGIHVVAMELHGYHGLSDCETRSDFYLVSSLSFDGGFVFLAHNIHVFIIQCARAWHELARVGWL